MEAAANAEKRTEAVVTAEMIADTKELLRLFGCPYIVSPAEAEAQCAALELLSLVDGVVTDDSDVFLFGATHVYRNIFEQKKYAERYLMSEISPSLGLDRSKLIYLAMLLGSDYTAGVRGIEIVNAMEVVNAFPGVEGLVEFKNWCYSIATDKMPNRPQFTDDMSEEEKAALQAKVSSTIF